MLVASQARRSAVAGPAASARTSEDRPPRICRYSRGHVALYRAPPDRPSGLQRVRGYSSGRRTEGLRRQAWPPRESTVSPKSLEGVDSALPLVAAAVPLVFCPLGP